MGGGDMQGAAAIARTLIGRCGCAVVPAPVIVMKLLRKRSFVQRLTEYRQIKRCALHKYIAK
jgi:hypothetical protein